MQAFLDSFDFMRLGQAITHNNQNATMMILFKSSVCGRRSRGG